MQWGPSRHTLTRQVIRPPSAIADFLHILTAACTVLWVGSRDTAAGCVHTAGHRTQSCCLLKRGETPTHSGIELLPVLPRKLVRQSCIRAA